MFICERCTLSSLLQLKEGGTIGLQSSLEEGASLEGVPRHKTLSNHGHKEVTFLGTTVKNVGKQRLGCMVK